MTAIIALAILGCSVSLRLTLVTRRLKFLEKIVLNK